MSLTGIDLARLRRGADAALPERGHLYRPTLSSDNQGGSTSSPSRIATVPCRVAPLTTIEEENKVIGERLAGSRGVWVTLPYHTDVRLSDHLVVNGLTYEVVSRDHNRSWHISLRVLCRELT